MSRQKLVQNSENLISENLISKKNYTFLREHHLNKQIFEYWFFYEPKYSNRIFLKNGVMA